MSKTNIDLVEHCKMALRERWGYVWGTFGSVLTEPLLNQRIQQYPSNVGNFQAFIRSNWMGRRVADCSGLIKSFLWWNNGNPRYNASQDLNANMMYGRAKRKGVIGTLPEVVGMGLFKPGHVGVYIGGGQCIEARSTRAGVIQSPVRGAGSAGWTHWMELPNITYVTTQQQQHITLDKAVDIIASKGIEIDKGYWINHAVPGRMVKGDYIAIILRRIAEKIQEGL